MSYVGETGRKMSLRLKEHLHPNLNELRSGSAISEHLINEHGNTHGDYVTITSLARERDVMKRKILESKFIND